MTANAVEMSMGHLEGRWMPKGKRTNVVAFPLSRSELLTPRKRFIKLADGTIAAASTEKAETIDLKQASERLRTRACA